MLATPQTTTIPIREILSKNIKLYLLNHKLTAQLLADRMGISVAVLHRVRHKACTRLDLDFLDGLFKTTQLGPEFFLIPQPGVNYESPSSGTSDE